MDYTSHFQWIDGGRLRDYAQSHGAHIPLPRIEQFLGASEEVLRAAADAAGWPYEMRLVQVPGKAARMSCVEVQFPDGTTLIRPDLLTLTVGTTGCKPLGMATMCTTKVVLHVPRNARAPNTERCVPAGRYRPSRAPTEALAEPQPSPENAVRSALIILHKEMGSWKSVAAAVTWKSESLQAIAEGRAAPPADLASNIARFVHVPIHALLSGRMPRRDLIREKWGRIQKRYHRRWSEASGQTFPPKSKTMEVLSRHGGDVDAAAAELGMPPGQLRAYGKDVPSENDLRAVLHAQHGNTTAVARDYDVDPKQVRRWLTYRRIDPNEYRPR